MTDAMKRTLRADVYLLLHSKGFWAILAVPVLILMDSPYDLSMHLMDASGVGSVYYHYFQSLSFGGLFGPYLVPMLCALPYAASLSDARASAAWRTALARGSRTSFFLSRFLVATLAGGLVYAAGLLLLFGTLSIKLPLFSADDLQFFENFFYGEIARSSPWLYVAITTIYGFFSGCIYAAFATAVSAFTPSRSAVIASPFVLSFALVRVEVLMSVPMQYRLFKWLTLRITYNGQMGTEGLTFGLCALCTLLIACAAGFVFCRKGRKVLENA